MYVLMFNVDVQECSNQTRSKELDKSTRFHRLVYSEVGWWLLCWSLTLYSIFFFKLENMLMFELIPFHHSQMKICLWFWVFQFSSLPYIGCYATVFKPYFWAKHQFKVCLNMLHRKHEIEAINVLWSCLVAYLFSRLFDTFLCQ